MAAPSFEHADEARAALRAIVSDPAHGPGALDNPLTTANLLQDFLPDAPRETGLLVAAASAGLPATLRGYVAQGMEPVTAIRLAAASLAGRTAFMPDACEWVAAELAIALGMASADVLPVARPAYAAAVPTEPATEYTIGEPESGTDHSARAAQVPASPRNRRRMTLAVGVAVLALAITASFAFGFAFSRQPSSPATSSHRTVTACTQTTLTKALVAGNPQLKALGWTLTAHACQGRWAVATLDAPSVGFGIAFLQRTASGWRSGALSAGAGFCPIPGAFGTPAPPRALASSLLSKVGYFCTTS